MLDKNKIGFKATLSLIIGNIIGVGIFTTTGYASHFLESPLLILLLWICGGIYALSGAVVYGILSKEYPLSGGDFQYLKNELHPAFGYMFGWSALTITYTGSIAALSIGAAHYFNSVFNLNLVNKLIYKFPIWEWKLIVSEEKFIAIILVIMFTWINYKGILLAAKYQVYLTGSIIIFIIIFSISGLITINESVLFFDQSSSKPFSLNAFLTAFIAIIFTYIGWTSAVYIAEEIDKPKAVIPKSLITGVLIITLLYVLINFVFLSAVPIEDLGDAINVATLVSKNLWNENTTILVSLFIFLAVLSTLNSTVLSGSRIYMAMSREGYLLGKFSDKHNRYNSPHKALILQATWSVILILLGTFNQLLSFVVFVIMIFSTLAGIISIKIIRKSKKKRSIHYLFCILYIMICFGVGINTLYSQFNESIIGIVLIFISFLFYLFEEGRIKEIR